jgi:hypothetical protein
MAKEVVDSSQEVVQPDPFSLEKQQVTIECDDGSEYVFERVVDRPTEEFRLARRVHPSGRVSTSTAALPAAVEETVSTLVSGWYK